MLFTGRGKGEPPLVLMLRKIQGEPLSDLGFAGRTAALGPISGPDACPSPPNRR